MTATLEQPKTVTNPAAFARLHPRRKEQPRTPDKGGGRFRILVGAHIGPGPDGPNHVYQARLPGHPDGYDGDVIESDTDLVRRFNSENSYKFERLTGEPSAEQGDEIANLRRQLAEAQIALAEKQGSTNLPPHATPVIPTPPNPADKPLIGTAAGDRRLEAMSIKELQELAAAEEVDLKGVTLTSKGEIIKVLRRELKLQA